MSTIYLMEHGMKVSKDGGRFIITKADGNVVEIPSGYIDCLVVGGNVQLSNSVILELLRNNKSIIYLERDGSILGTLGSGKQKARIYVKQLEAYNHKEARVDIARMVLEEKLKSQRNLLYSYNKRLQDIDIKKAVSKLSGLLKALSKQESVAGLMGVEGLAARTYFECFKIIIGNNSFVWEGRRKHRAPDPINCMLSFAYYLLEKDVRISLAEYGMLTEIGFLHELDYRKDSLVYDIMEPFRAQLADRVVLKAVNLKMFSDEDFIVERGACVFTEQARKRFIALYEESAGSFGEEQKSARKNIAGFIRRLLDMIRRDCEESVTPA